MRLHRSDLLLTAPGLIAAAVVLCAGFLHARAEETAQPDRPEAESRKKKPPESEDDVEEKREILEHLRGLGYVGWDEKANASLKGVVRHPGGEPSPGYNLYGDDRNHYFLIDMNGTRVHTWDLGPKKIWCEHAELLEKGELLAVCVNQSLTLLDKDSNVIWEAKLAAHHDLAVLPEGGFLVLFKEKENYKGRPFFFDGFATVSSHGKITARWSTFDHLDELLPLHPPLKLAPPIQKKLGQAITPEANEFYHANAVEVLPETPLGAKDARFQAGNIMLCLRNANLVVILDRKTLAPVWHWGVQVLDKPHMPTMLANGDILVFDNGAKRGYSRVLQVNPASGKLDWSYEGTPRRSFFSMRRGGNERLPNGDTLICESARGHAFEVTPEGKTIWEFWNPIFAGRRRRRMYRFTRVSAELAAPLLEK